MESIEKTWHLIAKALSHEASPHELEELSTLLNKDENLRQQYELLTRTWQEKQDTAKDEEEVKRKISKIITRAETEQSTTKKIGRGRRFGLMIGIAATLVAGIITVWLFARSSSTDNAETLIAKNGSRTRSLLPDGTTVWLNAGSQLFIETDFSGATREVILEGEAFFDVVKMPQHPFIVHTSGIDIKVLGTAFNVKAYPEDQNVETTLLRGLVQVFDQQDKEKKPIVLKPNQKLVLSKKAAIYSVSVSEKDKSTLLKALPHYTITQIDSTKKENEQIETAWIYSRLEFRGDNFEELAQKMRRWYNVSIVFTDDKVKKLSFNGSFEKETVEQAFEALHATSPNSFVYKINKHEISVGSPE